MDILKTREPMTMFEIMSVILSFATLLITIGGFGVLWIQLSSANDSLKTGIYTNISVWTYDLDKLFLADPWLRPYFYERVDIDSKDPNYSKVVTVAEYFIDTFDSMMTFGKYFPGGAPHEGWKNWIYDSFDTSPILARHIDELRRWYEPGPAWPIYAKWRCDHGSLQYCLTKKP